MNPTKRGTGPVSETDTNGTMTTGYIDGVETNNQREFNASPATAHRWGKRKHVFDD
jgi:hypothetical protein